MSGFADDAFSLESLGEASSETLEPGALADLQFGLRVEGWRERGLLLRHLTEQILEESSPELLQRGPASLEPDRGDE